MSTTFSQLIAATTEAAVRATVQAAGELVDLDFEGMPPNAVIRTMARSVFSPVLFRLTEIISTIARGGFLDFAPDGPWLEVNGEQVHETERIRLTVATSVVTFSNTSANVYNFTAGQVIVQNSTTKKTFRAPAFRIEEQGAPNDADVIDVTVTAIEAGSEYSSAVDDIDTVVTTFEGLEIDGSTAAVATDLEDRDAYIARCRLAASATSPGGADDAYRYVALSAVDENGVSYGITKVQVVSDNPDGTVEVFLAKASGAVGDAGVVSAIDAELVETVVPHGTDWQGASDSTPVPITVTYTALALAAVGLTIEEIEELVEAALTELFEDVSLNPIGGVNNNGTQGTIYASKIRATIEQVQSEPGNPRPIVDVTLTLPAGNTTILNGRIATLATPVNHNITLI